MSDFNSWDEVRDWLSDTDEMEGVFVGNMFYTHSYGSCGEGCCDESFDGLDDTIQQIKLHAQNDLNKVYRA